MLQKPSPLSFLSLQIFLPFITFFFFYILKFKFQHQYHLMEFLRVCNTLFISLNLCFKLYFWRFWYEFGISSPFSTKQLVKHKELHVGKLFALYFALNFSLILSTVNTWYFQGLTGSNHFLTSASLAVSMKSKKQDYQMCLKHKGSTTLSGIFISQKLWID